MPKVNRSAFSGVTWGRRHGRLLVRIHLGRRRVRLGYPDDFDDARRVYLGAKLLLQGFTQSLALSFACRRFVVRLDDRRPVTGLSQGPPR
jgi:hypothetical protein